jgi:DNA repair exonuclease SbcCD ATPase subunit
MKILSASVENFASYKSLEFAFDDQGLTHISGPTGSGKSTLADIVPWVLFGKTAKGGGVDDIRSWGAEETTIGSITLEINDCRVYVTRQRAPNDLLFSIAAGPEIRGKDLADTQRLLNETLGMDADTYLAGAYMHEFSHTTAFFTTTAKNRRQLTEQFVDLSMAKDLTTKLSEYKKGLKLETVELKSSVQALKLKLAYIQNAIVQGEERALQWTEQQEQKIAQTQKSFNTFAKTQEKNVESIIKAHERQQAELQSTIDDLVSSTKPQDFYTSRKAYINAKLQALGSDTCSECGALKDSNKKMLITRELHQLDKEEALNTQKAVSVVQSQQALTRHMKTLDVTLTQERTRENTYGVLLENFQRATNPHADAAVTAKVDLKKVTKELKNTEAELTNLMVDSDDVEVLTQIVEDFRGAVIKNAILGLQTTTNSILEKHFDGELSVKFDVAESDKLDVSITKDGNSCVFTQLSKGQRTLLKLSFGIAVMRIVANHSGIDFNAVFFDEALDGLSEEMKVQAHGLFEELALQYSSVFVSEHSNEFKNLFNNRYEVKLVNGNSQLERV